MTACFSDPEAGLPQEFTRLRALTSLKIHSRSDEWFVLSNGLLQGLSQLRSLHLQGVELQGVPDQDGDAFSSQDAVEVWQHLEDLLIPQVLPQDSVIRALPRLSSLTSLDLHYGDPEVEPELVQCVLACSGLHRLALQFFKTLSEGPYLSNLCRLSLSFALFLPHIPPALRSASRLTELDLSHCYEMSLQQQDLLLLQSLKKLRRLNLTRDTVRARFGAGDVSIMEEASALPLVDIEQERDWEYKQMNVTFF
ncbi:hypothetical protein N2152v2_002862 [Parachlorella kessleri]